MSCVITAADASEGCWRLFREPAAILRALSLDEVPGVLQALDEYLAQGLCVAGFVSYEAAPAFDGALATREPGVLPLAYFGVFEESTVLDRGPLSPSGLCSIGDWGSISDWGFIGDWEPELSVERYHDLFQSVLDEIYRGNSYQVNLSYRMSAPYSGSTDGLFLDLFQRQPTRYALYLDTEDFSILSCSPELFFLRDNGRIVCRPMKGTAARGRTLDEDKAVAEALRHDAKAQAENIMIVDMVRNDLARLPGVRRVRAERLFDLERHPTLWQMTSTVTAEADATLAELFTALFPCASITGAPKPRTTRIIADLEPSPRGIYCGSAGFALPDGRAQFNVAIRTLTAWKQRARLEYGVGGGVVADSTGAAEYRETRTKASLLFHKPPMYSLLETLRWDPVEGFARLELHLNRLRQSAEYFGMPLDENTVRNCLYKYVRADPERARVVRLSLNQKGEVAVEERSVPTQICPVRLKLAGHYVDSDDPFLYHKTTYRKVYDDARASVADCDQVVLWNRRGEVTETDIANLFVQRDGYLATPPVQSGLLAGTFRAALLESGQAREEIISLEDLGRAGKIFVGNSVRGLAEARLLP